ALRRVVRPPAELGGIRRPGRRAGGLWRGLDPARRRLAGLFALAAAPRLRGLRLEGRRRRTAPEPARRRQRPDRQWAGAGRAPGVPPPLGVHLPGRDPQPLRPPGAERGLVAGRRL